MNPSCTAPGRFTQADLLTVALEGGRRDLALHLLACAHCESEVDLYRHLLSATRQILNEPAGPVVLIPCPSEPLAEGGRCRADAGPQGLRVTVERCNGHLLGHLDGCATDCTCREKATVRLFGSDGFVALSPVDSRGVFRLAGLQPGHRYTLGLVMPGDATSQLTIIGDFALA